MALQLSLLNVPVVLEWVRSIAPNDTKNVVINFVYEGSD